MTKAPQLTPTQSKLVQRYLPLAKAIARAACYRGEGLDLDDLVQLGYQGLCDAALRYDPVTHPEVSFSNYAGRWVRKRICEGLATARVFHGSVRFERDRTKCRRAVSSLERDGYLAPTVEQVAVRTGLDAERVRQCLAMVQTEVPVERYGSCQAAHDEGDAEQLARVQAMLDQLDELGRKMVILCGVDGLSVSQAARRLGISPRKAQTEHDRACLAMAGMRH
jgi:RNA polymerase sigma factor (sigma-70 family)